MSITPNETEERFSKRYTHPFEWICGKIDDELVDDFGTGTATGILVSRFENPALVSLVISSYQNAGWTVSLVRDEELGDHIRIEK